MKRLLASLLFIGFFSGIAHAALDDEGVTREKTYVVHFSSTVQANTVAVFDLISLSTTASIYPHTRNNPLDIGEIDISHITMLIDKVATASATVKIGVLDYVGTSTGSASYFFSRSSLNNVSNTDVVVLANFTPSFYRTRVRPGISVSTFTAFVDGITPFFISNEMDQGSFIFNSTAAYQSTNGLMNLQRGDTIMKVTTFGSMVNFIVDVWYHA